MKFAKETLNFLILIHKRDFFSFIRSLYNINYIILQKFSDDNLLHIIHYAWLKV